jgi:hypothetical protein
MKQCKLCDAACELFASWTFVAMAVAACVYVPVTITATRMMKVTDVRGSCNAHSIGSWVSGRSNAVTIIRSTPDSPQYQGTEC